jgi:hypothetical protein
MLGGCLYETEEEKTRCLFASAILHRDSYVLYDAHGNRGEILIQPSSYTGKDMSKARQQLFRCFKTKIVIKQPKNITSEPTETRKNRIQKQEALALSYQRERVLNQSLI